MNKKNLLFTFLLLLPIVFYSQNVGIGTTTPNPKAALEIKATDKGILFPRLTSAQRDAISDPPNGLHIYNVDERCLNYYDSTFSTWSCYCEGDTCKAIFIHISANASSIDFYTTYAINYPKARKFSILVIEGITISGGINFFNMPLTGVYDIKIINRGEIFGSGGPGGTGASGQSGQCAIAAANGGPGGSAIHTRVGNAIVVDNYGIVAGGGGGGGGGGRTAADQYGGGGGGGAGSFPGSGGVGGGSTINVFGCGTLTSIAQSGTNGTISGGGQGGTGASSGGNGGNGGGRAQTGENGTGTAAGSGGPPGNAISSFGGSSGSIINNLGTGQSFGIVQ